MIHKSYFLEAGGFTILDHIKINNSNLFIGISEKQQESVSGGMFYMFYQNTNISTSARSIMNIGEGNSSSSWINESDYQLSQTTLVIASSFGGGAGGGVRRNNRRRRGSLFAKLFSFF
ncbi:hypothetical protein PN450_21680 [Dolichospermum lemmermannii CS-548]|uniref:hypothetical protein n=1 Tax=Dolichospermum lemmermannii TaxID=54295 RepID=UPI0023303E50|nr:hypothetical protein [Dolichospermum lemmermannii]MDB9439345.1 hypothetical protein [Dolichospermum lemmermannii CS-548]